MIRNVLQDIGGVELYPVISLILFFAVFGTMAWQTFRLHRSHVSHMGHLPLENDSCTTSKESK